MIQVKEFEDVFGGVPLEDKINDFLQKNAITIKVVDIKYNSVYDPENKCIMSSVLLLWELNE